ncbi:MAG: hypothetical protein RMM31_10630 [Anaerolineae bacterium]|nr:hypothetical protein [Anaerolineae bacterium]
MSNGQRLLIIPNDLREAATFFEQRGGEFGNIVGVLRREWSALEAPSEYAAEAAVAAACERAFSELLRSRQICAELAQALRLTADTLEDADRRAAALFRRDGSSGGSVTPVPPPWSGGGNSSGGGSGGGRGGWGDDEPPSWSDLLDKSLWWLKRILALPALQGSFVVKIVNGRKYIVFKPPTGSPFFWGIGGGVARNPVDLVRRFEVDWEASKYTEPLGVLEKYLPLVRVAEGVARKGLHPELLFHLGDFALEVGRGAVARASRSILHRAFGSVVGVFAGAGSGLYEATTDPTYEGRRGAAAVVKVGIPIVAGVVGVAAAAALTAVGAPVVAVVGIGAILVPTIIELGAKLPVGGKSIEDHLIDTVDSFGKSIEKDIQSLKTSLESTTSSVVERIHQAGQTFNQLGNDILNRFDNWFKPISTLPSPA